MKKFYVGAKGVVKTEKGVLLLKKAHREDIWEMPGGRLDEGESIAEALVRELNEEVPGINDIDIKELLGVRKLGHDIDGDTGLMLVYYRVEAKVPQEIKLSEEHEASRWINRGDDLGYLHQDMQEILSKVLG